MLRLTLTKTGYIFDHLLDFLAVLAGALILCACLIVNIEVIMRYFLNRPTIWALEICEYSLLWLTFLGTAWLLREGGHVKLDLLHDRLNAKGHVLTGAIIFTLVYGLCGIACMTITYYSLLTVWHNFQEGILVPKLLELPKAPILSVIVLGSLLLSIQFLREAYKQFCSWRTLWGRGKNN